MCRIYDLNEWRRGRLGRTEELPIYRRPRQGRREDHGLKHIGALSADIVRALMRE